MAHDSSLDGLLNGVKPRDAHILIIGFLQQMGINRTEITPEMLKTASDLWNIAHANGYDKGWNEALNEMQSEALRRQR